nr:retrotransposon-related protein [Tanacetum cinerariifolium]
MFEALQQRLVVENPQNAKEACDILAEIFNDNKRSRSIALKAELRSLKPRDLTIDAYFHKIKSISSILASLGSHISKDNIVNIALDGLLDKYEHVSDIIIHREPFPDLKTVRFMLSTMEMLNMSRDVLTVGSTMRIPLLYQGEYSQWVKRFINYLEEQTDGEAMINSIKNGLPNDIYSLIDSNKTAKDLWDALARHMLGSKYGEQDRKDAVLYEYETFKATEGELLIDTYIRYLQVINDLKKCGYSKDNYDAMQEEFDQFSRLKVWRLVPRPEGKTVIKTKWIFKNKKDESSLVIRNKVRLVAVGYSQQEGFVSKQYPDHVYALDKALYGLKQAPRAWYDVLSQFLIESGFQKVPTLMVEQAKLKLDLVGKPVDHTEYQSMIGSLMYVTSSRPDIMFATCLWYPKDSGFDLTAYSDADHAGCHLDRK